MHRFYYAIQRMNANMADLATREKAIKLRKKLIGFGLFFGIVGVIGVIVSFAMFAIGGFSFVDSFGDGGFQKVIIPFICFPISGIVAGLGFGAFKLGLAILITGEAAKLVDKSMADKCECGATIDEKSLFCPSCGKPIRLTCRKCGSVQEPGAEYCSQCGTRL